MTSIGCARPLLEKIKAWVLSNPRTKTNSVNYTVLRDSLLVKPKFGDGISQSEVHLHCVEGGGT